MLFGCLGEGNNEIEAQFSWLNHNNLLQHEFHFNWTLNKQRKQNSFHCSKHKCQKLFPLCITRLSFAADFCFSFQSKRPTPIDSTSNNEMAFRLCTHRIMNFIESVRRNCFRIPSTPIQYTPMPCPCVCALKVSTYLTLLLKHTALGPLCVCSQMCVYITRAAKRPNETWHELHKWPFYTANSSHFVLFDWLFCRK